jgi:MFS family permease
VSCLAGPSLTIALSTLSSAREYFDFIIFAFFVAVLSRLFFPPSIPPWLSQLETCGIFAAGYLAQALGDIIVAHYGDLRGRKSTFMFTISLMSFASLAIAVFPTYASIGIAAPIALVILRVMQGAAMGGEVLGAWTFASEHVSRERLGSLPPC